MNPQWASATWNIIHISASLTDKEEMTQQQFENFFLSLISQGQINCLECKNHTIQYYNHNPIENTGGKWKYLRWTFDFHNEVNSRLGKALFSWERCVKIYGNDKKDIPMCNTGCNKNIGEVEEIPKKGNLIAPPKKSYIEDFIPSLKFYDKKV